MIQADEVPPSLEAGEEPDQPQDDQVTEEPEPAVEDKPRKVRRRRKTKEDSGAAATQVEADSSPMVERPVDEEPPIAETEAPAEPKPKARRTRKKKGDVPEPAAPEAPPAETADEKEVKPKRRSRKAKASEPAGEQRPEPAPAPAADNDPNGGDSSGEPRRGWWQRTFG